jgi:hypothetical protein
MTSASIHHESATCRGVGLRALPEPDVLEHAWQPGTVCIILDDGGELAAPLVQHLTERGWQAVAIALDLSDQDSWQGALDAIVARSGRVAAFIDIHHVAEESADGLLWNQLEEARVKASFLLAGRLKPMLTAGGLSRAWYAVVTRVDGKLGLDAGPKTRGIVTAGVAALAKTLRQEWPSVFCRAIDLDPAMDPATAVRLIDRELHDPDATLTEVGHGLAGRCTIATTEVVPRA